MISRSKRERTTMSQRVQRSVTDPTLESLSWEERWCGPDQGLITCWEVGRGLAETQPQLAERARRGELPVLGWKGGVETPIKKAKYGTLNYLAQLQALRGEPLDTDLAREYEITCSQTHVTVIFTADRQRWGAP
jgi:hypothetical protein